MRFAALDEALGARALVELRSRPRGRRVPLARTQVRRISPAVFRPPKAKNPTRDHSGGVLLITSLTITYFHTGCSTIIGAKSFHGPVRDGKGWYQLAMVIRHDLYSCLPDRSCWSWQTTQSGRHINIVAWAAYQSLANACTLVLYRSRL